MRMGWDEGGRGRVRWVIVTIHGSFPFGRSPPSPCLALPCPFLVPFPVPIDRISFPAQVFSYLLNSIDPSPAHALEHHWKHDFINHINHNHICRNNCSYHRHDSVDSHSR